MTTSQQSTGQLVAQLTEQTKKLVQDEVALAKLELTEKAKNAGVGVGLFTGAGLIALFGLGALVATAILGLDEALPAWLSALIVALALFAIAGVAALVGKNRVAHATPPVPERTIESVRQDIAEVQEARHS